MNMHRFWADVIVVIHVAYVGFVVVGLLIILLGLICRWKWVRNFWFRMIHLLMIVIVGLEAAISFECPLTTLENHLRMLAGDQGRPPESDFVGYWANRLLFYDGVAHVYFEWGHMAFAVLVVAVFLFGPPRWPWRNAPAVSSV
jgi:hypothetical protein